MDRIVMKLEGPQIKDSEVLEVELEVNKDENYNVALARSLKKAQDDFNDLLTHIIMSEKRPGEENDTRKKKKKS